MGEEASVLLPLSVYLDCLQAVGSISAMASKRPSSSREEEEAGDGALVPKRPRRFYGVVKLAMRKEALRSLLMEMELFFRGLVQEELRNALAHIICPDPRQRISVTQEVKHRLYFSGKLPDDIYTGKKFSVPIAIRDANSNVTITSGPLASVRIEIVVLDGHFGSDGQEEWITEEFSRHVIDERDCRRPLLNGQRVIKLNRGAGTLDVTFMDNSSRTRNKMFRLGARTESGSIEEKVQEARTEAFTVKDNRGEVCQKYHPSLWSDEVWRLENIWKGGKFCKRLESEGIKTVEDFLCRLDINEEDLLSKLGRMPRKKWEVTIKHARESIPGNKLYCYCNVDLGTEIIFGIFGSDLLLAGAKFRGRYHPLSGLNASQKNIVKYLEEKARGNPSDIVLLRNAMAHCHPSPLPTVNATPNLGSSSLQQQNTDPPNAYDGELPIQAVLKNPHPAQHIEHLGDISHPNDRCTWQVHLEDAATATEQDAPPYIFDDEQILNHQATTSQQNEFNIDEMMAELLQNEESPAKKLWASLSGLLKFKMLTRKRLAAQRARILYQETHVILTH